MRNDFSYVLRNDNLEQIPIVQMYEELKDFLFNKNLPITGTLISEPFMKKVHTIKPKTVAVKFRVI